jgi:hypothetical protein
MPNSMKPIIKSPMISGSLLGPPAAGRGIPALQKLGDALEKEEDHAAKGVLTARAAASSRVHAPLAPGDRERA